MEGRSLKILIGLVAAAIMLSGWMAGWQWKREVTDLRKQLKGTAFTAEEQILIDLQDQLQAARKENDRLASELTRLEKQLKSEESETNVTEE